MYDFTGIGNACLDLIASVEEEVITRFSLDKSYSNVIDKKTKGTLKSFLPSLTYNLGGAASNVAHVISALGGHTAFMGRLADDSTGRRILTGLREAKIHYPLHAVSNTPLETAEIFCLTTPDAERTFASYYGISQEISMHDIHMETLQQSKIVYLDGYSLYSPHAKEAFDTILDYIEDTQTRSVFHCGDVNVVKAFPQEVKSLTARADIVIFNEKESMTCFPNKTTEEIVDDLARCKTAGALTLGQEGAYIFKNQNILKVNAIECISPPLDTCGAGDHFSGGFLYGLTHNLPLEHCGKLASLCAHKALFHFGARPQGSLTPLLKKMRDDKSE